MPAMKRSARIAPEVDLRECTLHSPPQKRENKAEPSLALNPEEMSPEIQNRGTSGPQKGHKCPPKNYADKNKSKTKVFSYLQKVLRE